MQKKQFKPVFLTKSCSNCLRFCEKYGLNAGVLRSKGKAEVAPKHLRKKGDAFMINVRNRVLRKHQIGNFHSLQSIPLPRFENLESAIECLIY